MPMKNSSTSGAIGAAPDAGVAAAAQPDALLERPEHEREADGVADPAADRVVAAVGDLGPADRAAEAVARSAGTCFLSQVASLARIRTPAWIFSQIRGTAKNSVGWTSRRLAVMVSIDSAKLRTVPHDTRCQVEKIRSATWHSGR